jgi:hypothetical protein
MINEIIEAISIALNAEFPDEKYEFHMEEIKQDLKEPCFFIACLEPSRTQFLGRRYEATNNFVIQYFPESSEYQRECNDVAERMTDCLEYITTAGDEKPIRGTNMKHETVDGVLNFFVNYDLFLIKSEETVAMESMRTETTPR